MTAKREGTFNVRLSDEERAMLDIVRGYTGLSASDVLRQGIRDAFRQLPASERKKVK